MRREHTSHEGLRMPNWIRRWVYAAGLTSFLSGAAWLLFHHFVRRNGMFGPEAHPLEHVWLQLHGAAAIALAWVLGLIWLAHVRRGWQKRRNLGTGAPLLIGLLLLAATGWGLYYIGAEGWRDAISITHWTLGLTAGAWLPLHVWRGRRVEFAG